MERVVAMWLPRDERRVLAYYYRKNPSGGGLYSGQDLYDLNLYIRLLHGRETVRDPSMNVQTIVQINAALCRRGLLNYDVNASPGKMKIDLTREGMILGQAYNSRVKTWYLWFSEWGLGGIISFLRGIIGR